MLTSIALDIPLNIATNTTSSIGHDKEEWLSIASMTSSFLSRTRHKNPPLRPDKPHHNLPWKNLCEGANQWGKFFISILYYFGLV